ncbi:cutinase family protein [Nocardia tengchongensis]|uniref:Cutinase family protein n=1 Tax=Nocardia tengchongensis TaxID=2055889 RepID=A0ABX8CHR4_9NOCA|nr:cutinase family protein [Nocardia tengchongensis]QVI19507.1 cutinase family protein [Nocardia tengchongensis]
MSQRISRISGGTAIALLCGATLVGGSETAAAQQVPIGPGCPALYALGVQGTGQSSPSASLTADTGVVGALLGPVVSAVPTLVQRSYVPYEAGFGGAVPGGGADPYSESLDSALTGLDDAAARVIAACPTTMLAVVGYSQGAQAVAEFAQTVGAGSGPVPADRIAGIALYSNPIRSSGEPVFPGRPGQVVPDPAPGNAGAAVSAVQLTSSASTGAGIADDGATYGALTGRVADICADGDLACSAPDNAAVLRLGAELAAQANLKDPISAIGSIQSLLSAALGNAWTTVLLNDFQLDDGNVDYTPTRTLAQRLTDATDPRIPEPSPEDATAATSRWNEITATVAQNPLVLLPKLVSQLSGAWGQFAADNSDLVNPAVWIRFADMVARHNGYATTGQLNSGIAWLIALAHDLAGS